MINHDRIVPVQRIDYLSLLGTVSALMGLFSSLSLTDLNYLKAPDVEGNFVIPDTYTSGDGVILTEPAKSIDISDLQAGAGILFVPAYNWEGFTASGAAVEVDTEIKADGISTYLFITDGNDLTVIALTPDIA